jgi:hypothetical protein
MMEWRIIYLAVKVAQYSTTHVQMRAGKMPDAKTMGRWGIALGPGVIKAIHDRIVQIALAQKVVQGRKMRVDTTVVESNIHYPTEAACWAMEFGR